MGGGDELAESAIVGCLCVVQSVGPQALSDFTLVDQLGGPKGPASHSSLAASARAVIGLSAPAMCLRAPPRPSHRSGSEDGAAAARSAAVYRFTMRSHALFGVYFGKVNRNGRTAADAVKDRVREHCRKADTQLAKVYHAATKSSTGTLTVVQGGFVPVEPRHAAVLETVVLLMTFDQSINQVSATFAFGDTSAHGRQWLVQPVDGGDAIVVATSTLLAKTYCIDPEFLSHVAKSPSLAVALLDAKGAMVAVAMLCPDDGDDAATAKVLRERASPALLEALPKAGVRGLLGQQVHARWRTLSLAYDTETGRVLRVSSGARGKAVDLAAALDCPGAGLVSPHSAPVVVNVPSIGPVIIYNAATGARAVVYLLGAARVHALAAAHGRPQPPADEWAAIAGAALRAQEEVKRSADAGQAYSARSLSGDTSLPLPGRTRRRALVAAAGAGAGAGADAGAAGDAADSFEVTAELPVATAEQAAEIWTKASNTTVTVMEIKDAAGLKSHMCPNDKGTGKRTYALPKFLGPYVKDYCAITSAFLQSVGFKSLAALRKRAINATAIATRIMADNASLGCVVVCLALAPLTKDGREIAEPATMCFVVCELDPEVTQPGHALIAWRDSPGSLQRTHDNLAAVAQSKRTPAQGTPTIFATLPRDTGGGAVVMCLAHVVFGAMERNTPAEEIPVEVHVPDGWDRGFRAGAGAGAGAGVRRGGAAAPGGR